MSFSHTFLYKPKFNFTINFKVFPQSDLDVILQSWVQGVIICYDYNCVVVIYVSICYVFFSEDLFYFCYDEYAVDLPANQGAVSDILMTSLYDEITLVKDTNRL